MLTIKGVKMSVYDKENIFAKILRKEMPCEEISSDENNLSFKDINQQAPIHTLTIPKNNYVNFNEFAENASDKELASFIREIYNVAKKKKLTENGYRIVINCGKNGNQEVPHLHAHLLGGMFLGKIL